MVLATELLLVLLLRKVWLLVADDAPDELFVNDLVSEFSFELDHRFPFFVLKLIYDN
jgi:hypothetical protein